MDKPQTLLVMAKPTLPCQGKMQPMIIMQTSSTEEMVTLVVGVSVTNTMIVQEIASMVVPMAVMERGHLLTEPLDMDLEKIFPNTNWPIRSSALVKEVRLGSNQWSR